MSTQTNFHNRKPLVVGVDSYSDFVALNVFDGNSNCVTFYIRTLEDVITLNKAVLDLFQQVAKIAKE